VPRSGIGLVLPHGRQRKVLVSPAGQLTAAGKHYYERTDQTPPSRFDFTQEPQRAGRSLMIQLLDGSRKAVSRFDPVAREFKPTVLGKKFYAQRKDRYTVLFPVTIDLTRTNGSIYSREGDWMPSSAVDLGQIEVSAALTQQEQEAEVKRQARAWMDRQPLISGERILLAGYETHRLDPTRSLQYNKLSFNQAAEPSAVMHRPLTAGTPWSFPFPGICVEAAEETDEVLRSSGRLLGASSALPGGVLSVRRLTDLNARERNASTTPCVSWHPNGKLALTAGPDKTLRLFRTDGVENPKLQAVHLDRLPVAAAAFTPDGSQIVACGKGKHWCAPHTRTHVRPARTDRAAARRQGFQNFLH
jgi:hypothetical protein